MHDSKPLKLAAECEMKPDELVTFSIPWAPYLRTYWLPGHRYALGEFVFLSRSTGYEYECTTAGISGEREPQLPKVVNATKADGSVIWTVRSPTNAALDPIFASVWTSDDVVISNQAKNDTSQSTSARLSTAAMVVGDYVVTNDVTTVSGDLYSFELTVKVRTNKKS